ncbi:Piwi-domain-containing protein [Flagelloscypha sp. PMI_526]|nr:Piwi-domain-containing protein [Flagelloscypha sp. PMI_526]
MSQRGFDRGRGRGGPDRGRGRGGGRGGGPRQPAEIFKAGAPAPVPAHLSDAEQNRLIQSFKSMTLTPVRPIRPGFGTLGRPIKVRANFFTIKYPKGPFYDYTVDFKPATGIGRIKGRLLELLEDTPQFKPFVNHIAHDRTQRIVSAKRLPQPLEIKVKLFDPGAAAKEEDPVYTIQIHFDKELNLGHLTKYLNGDPSLRQDDIQPILSAMNLIIHTFPSKNGVRVGQNKYFYRDQNPSVLGQGVEAWRGYFTSVRPTFKNLMVNANVCMTAFIMPGGLDKALDQFQSRQGGLPTLPPRFAKSIKPFIRHLKGKRALKAIGIQSARETKFDCQEFGGRISVEQYFKKKYKITLKRPTDLPVIDIGSKQRNVWIPAELCEITAGDPLRGRLDDKETAEMIRIACNPPATNAKFITEQGFPRLGFAPKKEPLNGFGVEIGPEMAVVPARELPPPKVSYLGNSSKEANSGSWNTTQDKFIQAAPKVGGWGVLLVRDGRMDQSVGREVQEFASKFKARCEQTGMQLGPPAPIFTDFLKPEGEDISRRDALQTIHENIKAQIARYNGLKPAFLLVMLTKVDKWIYPGIKRICDVLEGIPSITMLLSKLRGKNENQLDQYLANVSLKLNIKLGGRNHAIGVQSMAWLTKKPTMLVGIDVTHPSPGSRIGTPSIAAVVASVDQHMIQFPASLRIQKPDDNRESREMVTDLQAMITERLVLFRQRTKRLPERVMVFRDGVSEGQYDIVIGEELQKIKEALKRVDPSGKYKPTLSIIICGKRHHARFYPTDSPNATQNGNTKPGTVVDKGVTSVFDFDFYLQAHNGLQGQVRPTHYTVVYDENNLGADELQQGAHTFSYTYARATKAVSLIPPAYYADLACERGRCYLNDLFTADDRSSVGGRRGRDDEKDATFREAERMWGAGLHGAVKDTMFYI